MIGQNHKWPCGRLSLAQRKISDDTLMKGMVAPAKKGGENRDGSIPKIVKDPFEDPQHLQNFHKGILDSKI